MAADSPSNGAKSAKAGKSDKVPTPLTRRAFVWLDERVGAAGFARKALRKAFPDHWSFILGEVALYAFLLLLLTGVFLTFFFDPNTDSVRYVGPYAPLRHQEVSRAFNSAMQLSFEVRAGLVIRQIHHWAANIFVAAAVVHSLRVFFTGAFRKPRDINWLIGVGLLLLAMFAGFTGYSLPDDLLSGTGLRIAVGVLQSVPVIGVWAASLIFGGDYPAPDMIRRIFVIHILLIPAGIVGLVTAHLSLMWRQKHAEFKGIGRTETTVRGTPFYPNFAMKSVGIMFVVWATCALLGGLVQINPVWLYGPYDPYVVAAPAQPDWYMGWLEGSLRLWPNWEWTIGPYTIASVVLPGVVIPGVFFTVLMLWPVIERRITRDHSMHNLLLDRPRDVPWRTAVGAAAFTWAVVLTIAGSNDVIADLFGISLTRFTWTLRIALFVAPLLVGYLVYRVCLALRRSELHPIVRGPSRVRVVRRADGGFDEEHVVPPEPVDA